MVREGAKASGGRQDAEVLWPVAQFGVANEVIIVDVEDNEGESRGNKEEEERC